MAKKINIQPLGNRVVIEPSSPEQVTASGIILPDTSKQEKPGQGTVVAVGPGAFNEDGDERIPMNVKVGDVVLFSKYTPDEIEIDGKEYLVVREDAILGIVA